jgi:hypothetical protein
VLDSIEELDSKVVNEAERPSTAGSG